MKKMLLGVLAATAVLGASELSAQAGGAQPRQPMGFFITSVGPGDGGNLGGLEGADEHCQRLARAAGAGERLWRAYLSTTGPLGVNARDRIGDGPWYNATGTLIAANVADLHGDVHRDRAAINRDEALNERGERVNGRGDQPNQHDILTGSDSEGRKLLGSAATTTCDNWTSNSAGNAMVGHHDRTGGGNSSWNAAHSSRGCSQQDLVGTGGNGLFYCFAAN